MGCGEVKDATKNLPLLTMEFEPGNEQQKNYCMRIQQAFRHPQSIKFEIKSKINSTFYINLKIKEQIHQIQTEFAENEIDNTLRKMYDLLDSAFPNANNNNPNPTNENPNPEMENQNPVTENQNPNPAMENPNPNPNPNENVEPTQNFNPENMNQ